jgi:hypothetical protein
VAVVDRMRGFRDRLAPKCGDRRSRSTAADPLFPGQNDAQQLGLRGSSAYASSRRFRGGTRRTLVGRSSGRTPAERLMEVRLDGQARRVLQMIHGGRNGDGPIEFTGGASR